MSHCTAVGGPPPCDKPGRPLCDNGAPSVAGRGRRRRSSGFYYYLFIYYYCYIYYYARVSRTVSLPPSFARVSRFFVSRDNTDFGGTHDSSVILRADSEYDASPSPAIRRATAAVRRILAFVVYPDGYTPNVRVRRAAIMGGPKEGVQKQIQQDWANREYIEVITGSIKKITDFLNSFGKHST